ncbi:hypothetical protein [Shinella sp.]|uniref:hypothetical protein n=1 Tax=Shinella sp. TaxID=1870904 RepID=UPI00301D1F86
MDQTRSHLSDIPPLRAAFRSVKLALRDRHGRLEVEMATTLPGPLSRPALHMLRRITSVASGIDGLLSGVADRMFGDDPHRGGPCAPHGRARAQAGAQAAFPLSLTARRLGIANPSRLIALAAPAFGALDEAIDPDRASAILTGLLDRVGEPRERLALFSALLAKLAARRQAAPPEALADSAADLCAALESEVLAALTTGDPGRTALLLEKYSAHV